MLATRANIGMDMFLPPMVRFHELPGYAETNRVLYAPALSFHQQATAQQAIDALRQMQYTINNVYYLFVTDSQERLVGVVSLHQLLCAEPGARLFEFMDQRQITLPHDASLETQAHLMSQSRLLALPVVDEKGRLVGAMDAGDVIQAIENESTTGMYHLAGINERETINEPDGATSTYRTLWLVGNVVVGLLVAWIISSFANAIASMAVLAAFIPLISRTGGQAGTQSLTFIMRSLALGKLYDGNIRIAMNRELAHSLTNGLLIGLLAAVAGWLWQGQVMLGLIIGAAAMGSLLLATLVGAGVPLLCRTLHLNMSRSAAMIVSTVAEMGGLAFFLGMATLALQAGYL
jgi:magnesium transporter